VPDPEIPTVSLVDLGIVERVEVGEAIRVEILPTFSGCPAIDWDARLRPETPWRPSAPGRGEREPQRAVALRPDHRVGPEKLRASGFAPPPKLSGGLLQLEPLGPGLPDHLADFELADGVECPHCGSHDTKLDTPFGPTQCRAIYLCRGCRQAFEQFKPV
jgi:ring-1,2-phenylacetyl-CoA epoxidase subunit PaaD